VAPRSRHVGGGFDAQLRASQWLARVYRQLGVDGTAIVHQALIRSMNTKQIAAARGQTGPEWQRYLAKRFGECLNSLEIVTGSPAAKKGIGAVPGRPQGPHRPPPQEAGA